LYCFIVLLCICVVSCPYVIYYPTVMARYSLFVLKVPFNPKQTNKQTNQLTDLTLRAGSQDGQTVRLPVANREVFITFRVSCPCRVFTTLSSRLSVQTMKKALRGDADTARRLQ